MRLRTQKAALLLEVVVALIIMATALGILGTQLVNGLNMTGYAEQQTRATELSDRLLALLELDPETAQRIFLDRKTHGDFGDEYPNFLWQAYVQPVGADGIGLLTLEVLYQPDPTKAGEVDGAQLVRAVHLLKADPGRLNMASDFGLDDDALQALAEQIPIPGFDPTAIDPQQLVSLDPLQLMQILPALIQIIQQTMGVQGPDLSTDQILQMLASGEMPEGVDLGELGNQRGPGGANGGDLAQNIRDRVGRGPGSGNNGGRPRGSQPGADDGQGNSGGLAPGLLRPPRAGAFRGGRTPGEGGNGAGGGNNNGGRGNNPGGGGNTGGRGNNAGGGNNSGGNGPGSLGDVIRNRVNEGQRGGSGGGGGGNPSAGGNRGGGNNNNNPGGGNRGGGNNGNNGNRGGNGAGGGGGNNGQPHYTIEDLMRLRNGGGRGG